MINLVKSFVFSIFIVGFILVCMMFFVYKNYNPIHKGPTQERILEIETNNTTTINTPCNLHVQFFKIDNCEYILYGQRCLIHKGDCKNPIHYQH
jgi:hypothetical protein